MGKGILLLAIGVGVFLGGYFFQDWSSWSSSLEEKKDPSAESTGVENFRYLSRDGGKGSERLALQDLLAVIDPARPELSKMRLKVLLVDQEVEVDELRELIELHREKLPDLTSSILVGGASRAWAQIDPVSALDYAEDAGLDRELGELEDSAWHALAVVRPEDAVRRLHGLRDFFRPNRIARSVVWHLIELDPARAFDWMNHLYLQGETGMSFSLERVVQAWAKQDPLAAANALSKLKYAEETEIAYYSLVAIWVRKDLEAARKWVEGLESEAARSFTMEAVILEIAKRDGKGAVALALNLPAGKRRDSLMREIILDLAKVDPEEGLQLASKLERRITTRILQSRLRRQGPEILEQYAHLLPEDSRTENPTVAVMREHEQGFGEAIAWMERLESREDLETAFQKLESHLRGEYEPELVEQLLERFPDLGTRDVPAYHHLGHDLLRDEGTAVALDWLERIQNPAIRREALPGIIEAWMDYDLEGAAEFSQRLDNAEERRSTLSRVGRVWRVADERSAMEWAANLPDAQNREDVLQDLLLQMLQNRRGDYLEMVQTVPLPPDARQRILESVYPNRSQD